MSPGFAPGQVRPVAEGCTLENDLGWIVHAVVETRATRNTRVDPGGTRSAPAEAGSIVTPVPSASVTSTEVAADASAAAFTTENSYTSLSVESGPAALVSSAAVAVVMVLAEGERGA